MCHVGHLPRIILEILYTSTIRQKVTAVLVLFIVSVLFQVSTTHFPSVNFPHRNEFVSIVMHLRCKFPISAYFVACLQFSLYIGDFA